MERSLQRLIAEAKGANPDLENACKSALGELHYDDRLPSSKEPLDRIRVPFGCSI